VEITQGFGTKGYVLADNVLILKHEELATRGEEAVRAFVQRPGSAPTAPRTPGCSRSRWRPAHAERDIEHRRDPADNLDGSGSRRIDPGQKPQQRGLARPVLADQPYPLAVPHLDADIVQGVDDQVGAGVPELAADRLAQQCGLQRVVADRENRNLHRCVVQAYRRHKIRS